MTPTTPTPPPPDVPPTPRLERPREDRILSGVCAGIARHLGVDVTLVRIAAVVLSFIGGAGIVAYLVALAIVPDEGAEQPLAFSGRLDGDDRMPFVIAGLVLAAIVVGAGPLPWGWWDGGGWLLVLIAGAGVLWFAVRHRRDPGQKPTHAGPGATASAGTAATAVTAVVPPPDAAPVTQDATSTMPTTGRPDAAAPAPPRSTTPRIAFGAVLLLFGALGIVATTVDDLAAETAIAIAVLTCGGLALLAAPFGGVRVVLGLGFALASIGGVAAAADLELRGGFGERTEEPTSVTALPQEYRLAVGDLHIDLRDVTFPQGTTTVRARIGMGELRVRVPAGVTVVARARAGLGEAVALGRAEDGGGHDVRAESPASSPRRVIVDARAGLGKVEIEQVGVRRGIG